MSVPVKLGLLPSAQEIAKQAPGGRPAQPTELGQLGLSVAPSTGPDAEVVVVTDVDANADAGQNVRVGDVILEVSGTPVRSPEDLAILNKYWHGVVEPRSKSDGGPWPAFLEGGRQAIATLS